MGKLQHRCHESWSAIRGDDNCEKLEAQHSVSYLSIYLLNFDYEIEFYRERHSASSFATHASLNGMKFSCSYNKLSLTSISLSSSNIPDSPVSNTKWILFDFFRSLALNF